MPRIPDKSIDMILCDLPYGTTANKWDSTIPLDKLWIQYERIMKDSGVIVLTASQPFTSQLITSNLNMFRYCWVWEKDQAPNFLMAKKQPLKKHEDICVFSKKQTVYNPQMVGSEKREIKRKKSVVSHNYHAGHQGMKRDEKSEYEGRFPTTIIRFNKERGLHPTQKPVALFEYLIKTYTNEGDIVLDNCIGSGTTAVACINTKRNFIGIELEEKYYKIALVRIAQTPRPFDSSKQTVEGEKQ